MIVADKSFVRTVSIDGIHEESFSIPVPTGETWFVDKVNVYTTRNANDDVNVMAGWDYPIFFNQKDYSLYDDGRLGYGISQLSAGTTDTWEVDKYVNGGEEFRFAKSDNGSQGSIYVTIIARRVL